MPEIADPPAAIQPAKKTVLDRGMVEGRSIVDLHLEGKPPAVEPTTKPGFTKSLADAQARDKGILREDSAPPQEEGGERAKPVVSSELTKTKVPGLPPTERVTWDTLPDRELRGTKDPARMRDFAYLKTKAELAGNKIGELNEKIGQLEAELKSSRQTGPEIESVRKEASELREILREVAIERDPEFKRTYSAREGAAMEAAKLAAGEHADRLATLLKAPNSPWRDEQINELIEKLPASSQRRVNAALQVMEQIAVERSSEIARRRASFDDKQSSMLTNRKEQQAQEQKKMSATFDSIKKQWTDPTAGHPMFIERDGDADHNAGVKESLDLANAIFQGQMSVEELAASSFWAASGERLLKGWQAAVNRAEKAEKALDKIRGVQPGDGLPGSLEGGETTKLPSPGSPGYLKYWNNRMKEAQQKDFVGHK